jgi:hypothetical protein
VLHLISGSLLSLLRPARIAILARLCAQLSYTALLIAILSVNLRSIVLQQHPYNAGRTASSCPLRSRDYTYVKAV